MFSELRKHNKNIMTTRRHKQLDALNKKDTLTDEEKVKKVKLEKQIARSEFSREASPSNPITQRVNKSGKKEKKKVTKKCKEKTDEMAKENMELILKCLQRIITEEDAEKFIRNNQRKMKKELTNKKSKRAQELNERKKMLMIQKKKPLCL